jgi:hypothetical protein
MRLDTRIMAVGMAWVFFIGAMLVVRAADEVVDMDRARELFQKQKSGQTLSAEEAAYLSRARVIREQQKGAPGGRDAPAADRGSGGRAVSTAVRDSTGIIPLCNMSATDTYKGEDGGLYGGGRNTPPDSLQAVAAREAVKVVPLDKDGMPAADGTIVLLAIGMSNTTQEFSAFKQAMDADRRKSPRVMLVDGAQGGQGAAEWTEKNADRTWQTLDDRLARAGVSPRQVQALWLKQAEKNPQRDSRENARVLQRHLVTILNMAKARFPNLRIAFLSSRTYGGYSGRHPEPESFETAFSVRGVIQDQAAGKPDLNWDPSRGEVKAPLVLWGPYLWADGIRPRTSDGLAWERQDFIADGTHPSESGKAKVVKLLTDFFATDPHAKGWFLAP